MKTKYNLKSLTSLTMDRRNLNQSATGRSALHTSAVNQPSSAKLSAQDWEILETSFLKCLREIEKAYINLPKTQRIRVEKWTEKLVLTGNNPTWRKHRNAYARLLLNQVVSKNLSDPFHMLPPDGPLPSFPLHLRPAMKDLLGPHETSFWRGVYERYQEVPNKENLVFDGHSFQYQAPEPVNITPSFAYSREVDNLNLLIKEQNQRIQLLEQQLHEERVKHELQIQRLHYTHRMELNKLLEENTKLSKEVSVTNSFERRSFSAASPGRSNTLTPQQSASPSVYFGTRAKRVQSPLRSSIHSNISFQGKPNDHGSLLDGNTLPRLGNNYRYQHVDEDLARSQVLTSQQFDDKQIEKSLPEPLFGSVNQPQDHHENSFAHPYPPPPPVSSEPEISNQHNIYPGSIRKGFEEHHNMVYGDVANEYSADILPFPKFPLGTDSTLMDNLSLIQKTDNGEDEFLNYLDQFQNEIRQVNLDPTTFGKSSHE